MYKVLFKKFLFFWKKGTCIVFQSNVVLVFIGALTYNIGCYRSRNAFFLNIDYYL